MSSSGGVPFHLMLPLFMVPLVLCFFWCLHFTCLALTMLLTFPLLMHFCAFIIFFYSTYSTCSHVDGMLHTALLSYCTFPLAFHILPLYVFHCIIAAAGLGALASPYGFLVSQTLFLCQDWSHTLGFWFRVSYPWPCELICSPNFCCVLCLEARYFALHCCGWTYCLALLLML